MKAFILLLAGITLAQPVAPARAESCWDSFSRLIAGWSAPSSFEREPFLRKLESAWLTDNQGGRFRFDRDLTRVHHEQHGLIKNMGNKDGVFAPRALTDRGDLDWYMSSTEYEPRFRNLGFNSRLFDFFKTNLPEGSILDLSDSSETGGWVRELIGQIPAAKIRKGLQQDPYLSSLWDSYRKISQDPAFAKDLSRATRGERRAYTKLSAEEQELLGFRLYLADLSSIWGRIARRGNYRFDYRGPASAKPNIRIKRELSAELIAEEDRLLSAAPGGDITAHLKQILK